MRAELSLRCPSSCSGTLLPELQGSPGGWGAWKGLPARGQAGLTDTRSVSDRTRRSRGHSGAHWAVLPLCRAPRPPLRVCRYAGAGAAAARARSSPCLLPGTDLPARPPHTTGLHPPTQRARRPKHPGLGQGSPPSRHTGSRWALQCPPRHPQSDHSISLSSHHLYSLDWALPGVVAKSKWLPRSTEGRGGGWGGERCSPRTLPAPSATQSTPVQVVLSPTKAPLSRERPAAK